VATDAEALHIGYLVPLNSETRWSDLAATLIANDPDPLLRTLDLDVDPTTVRVRREVAIDAANRLDILIQSGTRTLAVLEIKVLSGLGRRQLERYCQAEPDADVHVVLFPQHLSLDLGGSPAWTGLTWEAFLSAYSTSTNVWVALAARAWAHHLEAALPRVGAATVWNALRDGEDFVVAMRARMAWLFDRTHPPEPVEHDLVGSAAGVSWVLRMYTPTRRDGYRVIAEVEENLPVRDYPKYASAAARQPAGPSAKVALQREGHYTSVGFDWDHLRTLWRRMAEVRSDWVTNPSRPRAAHDREGLDRIRSAGAPPWLGVGFGDAQAKMSGSCMFGARIQYEADVTLGEMRDEVARLGKLVRELAEIPHRA
jgi:hypothetical protein